VYYKRSLEERNFNDGMRYISQISLAVSMFLQLAPFFGLIMIG
jgi:hypothetical protein